MALHRSFFDYCIIILIGSKSKKSISNLDLGISKIFNDNNNVKKISENFSNRKSRASSSFTMNLAILCCVFFLGAITTSLFTIWLTDTQVKRNMRFQPLPLVEHLELTPELEFTKGNFDKECDGDNSLGLELEAVSAIHAAIEMKIQGKITKAQKLFQHALALCPRHPDILTYFGEFYEEAESDYIMADHLYVQALTYAPDHSQALVNRKRTMPVVEEIDEKRLQKIDKKRDLLTQMPESSSALHRVKKEAYFQHLYHTAAIEGNTMTLSQTRQIIETRMAIGGKSIIEHNEILGLDAAMKYINSSLVNRIGAITLDDILEVHRHVMCYVDPTEAGQFRRTQVYVGSHVPPSPLEISYLMIQLIEWLNSEEALSLHPIHYAAIFHYKLVHIHPFVDGNGRTSRLLMNWVLMQASYPPVIIPKQDRYLYYDHLNSANKGDLRPFIRFIAHCTEKTLDAYLWATQEQSFNHILGPGSGEELERKIDEV